jgi:hypothetical protein
LNNRFKAIWFKRGYTYMRTAKVDGNGVGH